MGRFVMLTFLIIVATCCALFLFLLFVEGFEGALYAGVSAFFLLLFPTAAGVVIYGLLQRLAVFNKQNTVVQALILAVLFVAIVLAWALAETALSGASTRALIRWEFATYMVLSVVEACCIPLIDKQLRRHPRFLRDLFKER